MLRSIAAVLLVSLAVCWTGYAANHPLMSAALKKKTQPSQRMVGTTCSDGSQCPFGNTCCPMSQGYGCCPRPNAVCCSDGIHCCEEGYTCGEQACIPAGNITESSSPKIREFESLLTAKPIAELEIQPCGSFGYCEDNQTCCPDGCCPYSGGVCCYDNTCCPSGSYCTSTDTCL